MDEGDPHPAHARHIGLDHIEGGRHCHDGIEGVAPLFEGVEACLRSVRMPRAPRVRMVVVSIEPTNPGAQREADGPIWTSIQGSRSSQVVATGEFGGGRSGE